MSLTGPCLCAGEHDAIELLMRYLYDAGPFCPRVPDVPRPGMGIEEGAALFSADHFGQNVSGLFARLLDSVNRKFDTETCHASHNRAF